MLCIRFGHCIADHPWGWAEEADEFSVPLVTCGHTHIISLISSHFPIFQLHVRSLNYISRLSRMQYRAFLFPWAVWCCGLGCLICDKYLVASRKELAYIACIFVSSCFRMAITVRNATDLSTVDTHGIRRHTYMLMGNVHIYIKKKKITSVCFYLPFLINYACLSGPRSGAREWIHLRRTHFSFSHGSEEVFNSSLRSLQ